MKYTIELTNKQKAQMDCIIDMVHRYVGFNPKLEPIKATNVEDTNEYEIGYKVGLEDGYKGYKHLKQWFADTCFYDDEDNLFPEYKRRQADTCCLEDIITDVGFSEVLKRVKAYEEKKKAEEVENYHILVDTLRTVTEEYPKETIVSALSEFGFEVDKLRGEEDEKNYYRN